MANKKDIELLEEYEELIALLRQLHDDVPVLEKQHRSIQQAFVSAQTKLEKTIAESDAEMQKKKKQILAEFEKECNAVAERVLLNLQSKLTSAFEDAFVDVQKACDTIAKATLNDAETRAASLLKEVQEKEKNVNALLKKAEIVAQQSAASPTKHKEVSEAQLEDGLECTGKELSQRFHAHINKDLFVKRIGKRNGRAWKRDTCMFVTEISNGMIYGDKYIGETLSDERVGYDVTDLFVIYRGPSEKAILKSRGR